MSPPTSARETLSLQIDGELIAENAHTLRGTVRVRRFASGAATCSGVYDARLERQILVSGAER